MPCRSESRSVSVYSLPALLFFDTFEFRLSCSFETFLHNFHKLPSRWHTESCGTPRQQLPNMHIRTNRQNAHELHPACVLISISPWTSGDISPIGHTPVRGPSLRPSGLFRPLGLSEGAHAVYDCIYSGMPSALICSIHAATRSSDLSGSLSSSHGRPTNLPSETDLRGGRGEGRVGGKRSENAKAGREDRCEELRRRGWKRRGWKRRGDAGR